ncbi:PREDICTED: potassium/sodium hyperpolarization-activated cyclic nucleotide-gated channel 1-like, partial [Nicrophorus vespilloides]|uniref:Potassium/sodium hyperpolarization-activated cyclic nucleotide-gated channel 1-like n=1 Tax=Nicrophorus vespilloides TaxID=110193 RepID=A0ABM1M4D5_NICVS
FPGLAEHVTRADSKGRATAKFDHVCLCPPLRTRSDVNRQCRQQNPSPPPNSPSPQQQQQQEQSMRRTRTTRLQLQETSAAVPSHLSFRL